jgi:hypothetical protein
VTIVRLRTLIDSLSGPIGTNARVLATPTGIRENGAEIIFPGTLQLRLTGELQELNLEQPNASWAWRIDVFTDDRAIAMGGVYTWAPATATIDWADLTEIDPATLVPLDPAVPGVAALLDIVATLGTTAQQAVTTANAASAALPRNPLVVGDNLLFELADGTLVDAGPVRGLQGYTGDMTPFTNGTWGAGAQTVNAAVGAQTVARTLTGNVVLSIVNTPVAGRAYTISLSLKQDTTGGRTITWPAAVVWPEGLKPALPVAPNALATYHLYWDGVRWVGIVGGLNLA